MGPRVVQLMFYILAAVYLYRTIYLFREKETALLGATIYLFSPIIFSYASRASLASGTVFFVILIAYYFLRFIKYEENRDLILLSFFIGIGFMYKRIVLVMFIICFVYLLTSRIMKSDRHSNTHLKVLVMSLISVFPFYIIGRSIDLNYFVPIWSRLISFDSLMIFPLMIESQISFIIFFLFLISFIFILLTKRDNLSFYFGFFIIAYYFFITITKNSEFNHRYAMVFYPAIAVYLAQFVFRIVHSIRWKHSFILVFSVLTVYLIVLNTIPRTSSGLITYKYDDHESQYYPVDEATDWILNNTENIDKILTIFMPNYEFYLDRIYANKREIKKDRFFSFSFETTKDIINPIKNLMEFCYEQEISYIMFPFGPNNTYEDIGNKLYAKYLNENRDTKLEEVARFMHEDNFIIISKVIYKDN
jgi:hypothetical protein